MLEVLVTFTGICIQIVANTQACLARCLRLGADASADRDGALGLMDSCPLDQRIHWWRSRDVISMVAGSHYLCQWQRNDSGIGMCPNASGRLGTIKRRKRRMLLRRSRVILAAGAKATTFYEHRYLTA